MGNLFSPKLTIYDTIVEINGISLNDRCFVEEELLYVIHNN